MAIHSSILAWRIPGTEEPDGLQSMGSQRVRHDRHDLADGLTILMLKIKATHTHTHTHTNLEENVETYQNSE